MRSLSEHSVSTNRSNNTSNFSRRHTSIALSKVSSLASVKRLKAIAPVRLRGAWLWRGKKGKVTENIVTLPWKTWWKTLVIISIVFCYVSQFLLAYYIRYDYPLLNYILIGIELVYAVDVFVHLLNSLWPVARHHVRVIRRHPVLMCYDVFSLIPFITISVFFMEKRTIIIVSRWLKIIRIYKILLYFKELNQTIHESRRLMLMFEHLVLVMLILHGATCFLYSLLLESPPKQRWYKSNLNRAIPHRELIFKNYISCWYFSSGRLFNVIFGDAYPSECAEKWFATIIMIVGFVFIRYKFIGTLVWEMVTGKARQLTFIDRYHHMLNYLHFRGTPASLIDQAAKYKQQLWTMKDGILSSRHLQKLPLPLQMELIFDINVGHFHDSLLFRNTGEAFMRHVSLLMRHEIFLAGQQIWSQGVVKSGMICVKRGVIEMLSDEDDESPMISFNEKTVLGELSLFYSIPSKITVKAATYVELQVLRRTDFLKAMWEDPYMLQQIRKTITERLKGAKKRQVDILPRNKVELVQQKAIEEYDRGDSRLIRTRYRPMKVLKDNLAGVEEEDPTFVDDSHMYYKDENNVRRPKFTSEYLELYRLSSNVTTVETPRICLKSTFPWILEPDTEFTFLFDLIHFFLVVYVCFVTPYDTILNSSYRDNYSLQVVNTVVKAFLAFNIYIQLTTAIVIKNVRKDTVKEIANIKMSTFGFYLDILSIFPVHIFTDILHEKDDSVCVIVAKLFPVLQVWHVWKYLSKWELNFHSNIKLLCLLKHTILLLISCYWTGSLLYLWTCPRKFCKDNSWMARLIHWETKVITTSSPTHERPALTSLNFGTSVFTGTGFGEISPGAIDLVLVQLSFMVGAYFSFFYIARLCSYYILFTRRRLKFKESMRELFYFLTVNHVSSKIKARVQKFFCVQWYYNSAVSTDELFSDMSSNMQQEILSIEMVETLLYCPLFQECSRDFLQTVAANTRTIVLPDNEIVQHAGDIGRDMYIVQKGHCNVLCNLGKKVMSLGPGSHFGDIEMLFGLPKVYTVLTTTNCLLLHIEYSSLVQCWSAFPDISHHVHVALSDPKLIEGAKEFEEAKPLTGKLDTKKNRIAQEIKESFVIFNTKKLRMEYNAEFQKLGLMRHLKYFMFSGCITPHGIFLKIWCLLRFLLAFFYITVIPYNLATKQYRFGNVMFWTDLFMYVDLFVMSYVAYYDDKSLLITHPLLTVTRYIKTSFLFDLLTVFPFEYLFRMVNINIDMDMCRINRILLISRISGTLSYWESDIMRINHAVVLFKFLPVAVTVVNLATSALFTNNCKTFKMSEIFFLRVNCTGSFSLSNNYVAQYALREYIKMFYWVFEIFIGSGCTSVYMNNRTDVCVAILMKIIGYLYFAFMFGYVASTRSAAAHALLDHTEKTKDLANFLYQENVEPILTVKTLKYFEYIWKRTNGSNPQQICRRLNSALMEDTLVFMYEKTLREVPLFGKVERSFIRVITQHLSEMYFLKEETVIQCKDVQPYIYIIYRGKADVLSSYNEMVTCMGPGGMFGNFTGQPISCSEVSVYASRSLDLLVIPSQTFFNLVKFYPKIQEPLNKAFEMSRDYILPISIDLDNENSDDSDKDFGSIESEISKSESARLEISENAGGVSVRSSYSSLSQARSVLGSVSTFTSYISIHKMFLPGSYVCQLFGYFTCVVTTCSYFVTLYEITTLNDCLVLFWLQSAFDVFFHIKLHLTMHQAYPSKRGDLIQNARRCRKKYFESKCRFWTDIIANFPLEIIAVFFQLPSSAFHYLRINKILRLKYLVEFYEKTSSELTNNLTVLQSTMTMIIIVLFLHSFACFWLIYMVAFSRYSVKRPLKSYLFDRYEALQVWDYSTAMYLIVAQMTTTGGEEYSLSEMISTGILAFCLIFGKMVAAVVVATFIQAAYSSKHALTVYERETKELIDVLKNQGLSSYQLGKFLRYVQQLWQSEHGRQLPALLAQTPYVRRCDLMMAMFGHHLRNCYIFSETGEPFLRQLSVCLDYTIFFPGNYIVVAGDSEARMYWVSSGQVSVVSVRPDLTESTHELLGPGDVFGLMQGLNKGVIHCFSYRAETKVSILSLSLDTWFPILQYFPEAKKIIAQRSEVLFTRI